MANPSKRKGTAFEVAVCQYLRDHGLPNAERRALQGSKDRGDTAGIPDWVLEQKAAVRLELSEWIEELRIEKQNAEVRHGAVIIKRRSHPVGKSYAVMELDDLLPLIIQSLLSD